MTGITSVATFHQLKLEYKPNQKNPAHTSGKGVWRVVRSYRTMHRSPRVQVFPASTQMPDGPKYLYINAEREYKKGSRVDPRKVLGV